MTSDQDHDRGDDNLAGPARSNVQGFRASLLLARPDATVRNIHTAQSNSNFRCGSTFFFLILLMHLQGNKHLRERVQSSTVVHSTEYVYILPVLQKYTQSIITRIADLWPNPFHGKRQEQNKRTNAFAIYIPVGSMGRKESFSFLLPLWSPSNQPMTQ